MMKTKLNEKNYYAWHKKKEELHSNEFKAYFHEREIWWCSLGLNVGYEQDGKNENYERPILVLKKFNKEVLWEIPMTSQDKTGKYYYQFEYKGKNYSLILSQLRLISSRRLLRNIRTFPRDDFEKVKEVIRKLLE